MPLVVTFKKLVFGTTLIMVLLATWVLQLGMPGKLGSTEELVRLRNALLIEPSRPSDFNWTPKNIPRSFSQESADVPSEIKKLIGKFQHIDHSWIKTLAIASELRSSGPNGKAIQSDTITTLAAIREEGRGYCSDFTQVVNALAYAIGLSVREWGISFDGFGGWGHAFSEVFIPEYDQWVFIDVFHGFHVSVDGKPLSVLQFQRWLATDPTRIVVHPLAQGRFLFRSKFDAIKYYHRGYQELYLWWGNNSLTYDQHPIIRVVGRISRSLEQLFAIALGQHPTIRIFTLPENQNQIDRMHSLKWQLLSAFWIEVFLTISLLAMLWHRWHQRNKLHY